MHFFNTLVAHAIPWIPRALVQKISRRYIAGDDLAQAVGRIRQLNAQGFCATVDVLGETVSTAQQAEDTAREYTQVLQAIRTHGLDATISVKPTALGLLLDSQACERKLQQLVRSAAHHATAVCIDMEDVSCTQREIELFSRIKARHSNVSLALQAYLQRTYQDIEPLLGDGSSLRICKGIYLEDRSHLVDQAWSDRGAINPHFLAHVARCLDTGTFVGVATHDADLVEQVIALARLRSIDPMKFEFQMLLGVCEPLRDRLLGMGFKVRIYLPYGKDWYGYSTRRMKENPRIAGHVARALIGL
jgi:proline dehydrogenase